MDVKRSNIPTVSYMFEFGIVTRDVKRRLLLLFLWRQYVPNITSLMINSCRTAELVNPNNRTSHHSESNHSASTHNKSSYNTTHCVCRWGNNAVVYQHWCSIITRYVLTVV